jgi:hypothetical protein
MEVRPASLTWQVGDHVVKAVMGEFLGRVHRILRGCPAVGAWTPGEVLRSSTGAASAPAALPTTSAAGQPTA